MRPAGIYKSHDLMTYISGPLTSDFGQIIKDWARSQYLGHLRLCLIS